MEPDMSPREARGYIRARAAVIVHREVDWTLARERHVRPSDRAKLISLVTDEIVAAVARDNWAVARRAA
jgi:hypothetical protein